MFVKRTFLLFCTKKYSSQNTEKSFCFKVDIYIDFTLLSENDVKISQKIKKRHIKYGFFARYFGSICSKINKIKF